VIVVLAPYGRNEVTAAAIRVADLVLATGAEVRFAALGVRETGIHPYWDTRVRSGRGDGLYRAARGAHHCLWFACSKAAYRKGSLVANGAVHTLVPPWHSLRRCDLEAVTLFDRYVCPDATGLQALANVVFAGNVPEGKSLSAQDWDSGLAHTRRAGLAGGVPRVLVYHDSEVGGDLLTLELAGRLLDGADDVGVTLLCACTFDRRTRQRLRTLADHRAGRLACVYQRSLVGQVALFGRHDVLVLPQARSDYGLTAARGLACGLVVVCHDVPPLSNAVRGGPGHLVPCQVRADWLGLAAADPVAPAALADAVLGLLRDRARLTALQAFDWRPAQAAQAFEEFWRKHLGLV